MEKAFTLVEVLIYTAITAIIGMLLTGILLTVSQVHQRESAATEVGSQLNFIIQRIGQLTRESSNIEIAAGVSTSTLKLRMKDPAKDPTCISLVNGVIKLAEGPGANKNECTTTTSDLTNNRVIVDSLNFKKFTTYPGHDTISIDIQITYNSQNPKSQVTRNLTSAIARVSAATFDSSILPGSTSYEIGQQGSPWSRTYLSDGTALNPSYTFGNDTSLGIFKVSGTSTIGFSTQGLERMRIDANGNVGIGTTAPTYLLQIDVPDTISDQGILIRNKDAAVNMVEMAHSVTGNGAYLFMRNDAGDANIQLRSYGNSVFNGGNVGIGTTTPSELLHIYKSSGFSMERIETSGISSSGAQLELHTPDGAGVIGVRNDGTFGASSNLGFRVGATNAMVITNTGNVGIGTTTPGEKLDVNGNIVLSGGSREIHFKDSGGIVRQYIWLYSVNNALGLGAGGIPTSMFITTDGNVGIGTAAPGYKLQVGTSGDGTSAIANAWNVFSDIRLKTNITPLTDILPKLNNINAVGFNWKDGADKKRQIGFIAQEIEKVFPELVSEDDKGYKSVDYSKFSAILLGAVKEQQQEIKEVKAENQELRSRLEILEKR